MKQLCPLPPFLELLRERPGLIPCGLNLERERVVWQDLGRYHCHESFFDKSLALFAALSGNAVMRCETGLDALDAADFTIEAVPLAGFVFHAGRSRSTLLARMLARSRTNLVLSEPQVVNTMLTLNPEMDGQRFRNLILAMCRRRIASHQRAFVKFSSHSIHHFARIRAAFPEVPAIFLSRSADAIIASFRREPPRWAPTGEGIADAVQGFLRAAAAQSPGQLTHIDGDAVSAPRLAELFGLFDYRPPSDELAMMTRELDFDSKQDLRRVPYGGAA